MDETYKAWKMPRAPRPKFEPRTGKNLSKKLVGNPTSERKRKMHSPRMRRRFTTAQKTPAGWLGTVVSLQETSDHGHQSDKGGSLNVVAIGHVIIEST